jgi:hypothetical protein
VPREGTKLVAANGRMSRLRPKEAANDSNDWSNTKESKKKNQKKPHAPSDAVQPVRRRSVSLDKYGRQFESLFQKWTPLNREAERRYRESHAAAIAGSLGRAGSRRPSQVDTKKRDLADLDPRIEALHRKMEPLARRILELPVTCAQDLRPGALVALHANVDLWSRPVEELQFNELALLRLIEGCCGVFGIALPPGAGKRKASPAAAHNKPQKCTDR